MQAVSPYPWNSYLKIIKCAKKKEAKYWGNTTVFDKIEKLLGNLLIAEQSEQTQLENAFC